MSSRRFHNRKGKMGYGDSLFRRGDFILERTTLMKKLIALLTLVFCFNCYSQKGIGGLSKGGLKPVPTLTPSGKVGIPKANSKPIHSITGLEGWGKKEGVNISVEDYSNRDKTFDAKAIKNQVELKLRLAGIKVVEKLSSDRIYIHVLPITIGGKVIGYFIDVKPTRRMTFKYNEKEYIAYSSSNVSYERVSPPNYRKGLEESLDELLLDYLKANPKDK